jgi:hypothetical protein
MKKNQGYVFADSRGARAAFGRPRAASHSALRASVAALRAAGFFCNLYVVDA